MSEVSEQGRNTVGFKKKKIEKLFFTLKCKILVTTIEIFDHYPLTKASYHNSERNSAISIRKQTFVVVGVCKNRNFDSFSKCATNQSKMYTSR